MATRMTILCRSRTTLQGRAGTLPLRPTLQLLASPLEQVPSRSSSIRVSAHSSSVSERSRATRADCRPRTSYRPRIRRLDRVHARDLVPGRVSYSPRPFASVWSGERRRGGGSRPDPDRVSRRGGKHFACHHATHSWRDRLTSRRALSSNTIRSISTALRATPSASTALSTSPPSTLCECEAHLT